MMCSVLWQVGKQWVNSRNWGDWPEGMTDCLNILRAGLRLEVASWQLQLAGNVALTPWR